MNVIMTTCNFSPLEYTTDKDRVVNNIRVEATRPDIMRGENAAIVSEAASIWARRYFLWLLAAAVFIVNMMTGNLLFG
jgi:hypothetical protein